MARFCGLIGFVHEEVDQDRAPGVFVEKPTERFYYGDTLSVRHSWDKSETLNDDLNVSNRISIVADEFAYNNVYAMRYVKMMGACWKINSVEVQRPRLILSLGGVYNGITCGPA